MKKVIFSVTNDLTTDKRVHKACLTLYNAGFDVTLIGRRLHDQSNLERPYKTIRLNLFFKSGFYFYAFYNIRLFLFLLTEKADILVANDLDTLPANYLSAKLFGRKLVYDTHEYFCHVPELTKRPFVQKIWHRIEKLIFPKLKTVITVNNNIASLYSKEYNVNVHTIHNYPITNKGPNKSKSELGIPTDKHVLIYQGALNKDRGLEELIYSMEKIENVVLLIIGGGDVENHLKEITSKLVLKEKVLFIGKLPFEKLHHYTANADIGIAIEKDTNLNYKYSLSNKLFDYIHAGLAILGSNIPETNKLVTKHSLGLIIENHETICISEVINKMLSDQKKLNSWKLNSINSSHNYNWEQEEIKLLYIYQSLL